MPKHKSLLELYNTICPVVITAHHITKIIKMVRAYELRDDHVNALQSPLLGIAKMYFLPKDQRLLFDEMEVDFDDFKSELTASRLTDPNQKVISDPFNQFTIWLVHRIRISKVSAADKLDGQVALLKLLHYKFFTSRVNRLYPYGANPEIMMSTIEQLSEKYDIKKPDTPTWQLVIEKRARDIIAKESIHTKVLDTFMPDKGVGYVISDIQTRLRDKLRLINNVFHEAKRRGETIGSYTHEDQIDGKRVLKPIESTYGQMILGVTRDILTLDKFLDSEYINLVAKLVPNIRPDMVRRFLTKVSDIAVNQYKNGKDEEVVEKNGSKHYVGYKILVSVCISATYRIILTTPGVNLKSKVDILTKAINQYRASRVKDDETMWVKDSVLELVKKTGLSKRAETLGALRLVFIVYIVLLSFRYS